MAPPLVSILIPLYNHEQFIVRCLDSIIEDTYPAKEVIVIDDGSKDGSAEAIRQWRAAQPDLPYPFTFISRENRGLTKTLNELLTHAQGELIAVLASDDYLLPGGIEARVAYLEQNRDKLAVFADCRLVDYNGTLSGQSGLSDLHGGNINNLKCKELVSYEMVFNWCVPGPVFMARKNVYDLVGGYNEQLTVEDWDFYLRLAARNLLGFVHFPVAAYRVRPDEMTRKTTIQQQIAFNEALLQTVEINLKNFSGLKKAYLYAERMKFYGIVGRLKGNNSFRFFLARKAGRLMLSLLKAFYRTWAYFKC